VVAALLLALAGALLAVHAYGYLRWGARPTQLEPGSAPAYRIDLNRADRAELLQLDRIGPHLAERIEAYRRDNGGFRSVDELARVPGIGPAALARLRPLVCVEADREDEEADEPAVAVKQTTPPPRTAKSRKAAALTGLVDVNRASEAELRRLDGVGLKTAQAIIEERARRPFQSVDDLRRVRGIGAKTLERLRPYVTVRGEADRLVATETGSAAE
jgi:competence protein ComEA